MFYDLGEFIEKSRELGECRTIEGAHWDVEIDFFTNRLSLASDSRLDPEKRKAGDLTCSTAIIDACRPWAWRDQFPKTTKTAPQVMEQIRQKWGKVLFG